MKTFAVIGRTRILIDAAELAAKAGFTPTCVVTCAPSPEDGSAPKDFRALAKRLGVPFAQSESIGSRTTVGFLRAAPADVAISVNWKGIIPREVLDLYPRGVINAHSGDLPRYRGNAPLNWAILNGERKVAFTLHLMTEELDGGPILLKGYEMISEDTRIGELVEAARDRYPGMFVGALVGLREGTYTPTPQPADFSLWLRGFPRCPEDGRIDWSRSALEIHRLVRAVSEPYSGAFCYLRTRRLTVWRAERTGYPFAWLATPGQVTQRSSADGWVEVATGDGILRLLEVSTGTKRVQAAEAVRSARDRLTSWKPE